MPIVLDRFAQGPQYWADRKRSPVGVCAHCEQTIYDDEERYRTYEGDELHEDCWDDYAVATLGKQYVVD